MSNHVYNGMSDEASRKCILNYMATNGFFFVTGSQYAIDLLGVNVPYNIEVEQRTSWHGTEYPYDSYHFLDRKAHLFTEHTGSCFCVVNADMTSALLINEAKLKPYLTDEHKQTVTCRGKYQDTFYNVPIAEFTLLTL